MLEKERGEKGKNEEVRSSGRLPGEERPEEIELNLKRAKSSMPYREPEGAAASADYDGVSLGDRLELR